MERICSIFCRKSPLKITPHLNKLITRPQKNRSGNKQSADLSDIQLSAFLSASLVPMKSAHGKKERRRYSKRFVTRVGRTTPHTPVGLRYLMQRLLLALAPQSQQREMYIQVSTTSRAQMPPLLASLRNGHQ